MVVQSVGLKLDYYSSLKQSIMHIPQLIINDPAILKDQPSPPTPESLSPDLQPHTSSPPTFLNAQVPVPCKLGPYLITSPLPSSSLYHCVNVDTHEQFVCKVVDNETTLVAHARLRHHPASNPVREVVLAGTRTLLVHPRSYGDLHTHVREARRLLEPEAQALFAQIVGLVATAHAAGMVLRDVKLRKFVFADPHKTQLKMETLDDVILIDQNSDHLTDRHGCPAYVSPEILESSVSSYSGRAADCWSLGIMLYVMLLGRYPFHDADPSLVLAKVKKGHYKVSDTLSSQARCLIRSLLRKEPSERLSAEEVLGHPWFKMTSRKRPLDKSKDQMVPVWRNHL